MYELSFRLILVVFAFCSRVSKAYGHMCPAIVAYYGYY